MHHPDQTLATKATNWDQYYDKPSAVAHLTRKITEKKILGIFNRHPLPSRPLDITELGGGNSCFYDGLSKNLNIQKYAIVDNNQTGLDQFKNRYRHHKTACAYLEDVLDLKAEKIPPADIVFSIGLIEHFPFDEMKQAIEAHFQLVKSDGLVVISFPTPTLQYRLLRKSMELAGVWQFHDERPQTLEAVATLIHPYGVLIDSFINWRLPLTQAFVVARPHRDE